MARGHIKNFFPAGIQPANGRRPHVKFHTASPISHFFHYAHLRHFHFVMEAAEMFLCFVSPPRSSEKFFQEPFKIVGCPLARIAVHQPLVGGAFFGDGAQVAFLDAIM